MTADLPTADAHFRRGKALIAAGDHAGAAAAFTAALRLRPGHADALNNRGVVRAALGDRAGAFADYDAAIAADPTLAPAFNNRALARFRAGDLDAALADLQTAVRLDPAYAVAYENCAMVNGNLFEFARAVASFDRAIELYDADPRFVGRRCTARALRGLALYHLRQRAAALEDLRAAYRLDKALCVYTIAAAVEKDARAGRAAAVARCDSYLADDPNDFFTVVRRGLTHLILGNRPAALADYDAALWAPVEPADFEMGQAVLKTIKERLAAGPRPAAGEPRDSHPGA